MLQEPLQTLHRTTKKTANTEDGITGMLLWICLSWLPFFHFVPGSEVSHKPSSVTITWTSALLTSQPRLTATMVTTMEIMVIELITIIAMKMKLDLKNKKPSKLHVRKCNNHNLHTMLINICLYLTCLTYKRHYKPSFCIITKENTWHALQVYFIWLLSKVWHNKYQNITVNNCRTYIQT